MSNILEAGKIKIGVPENFPPFGSVGKDLKHEGYDVDVGMLIAKDLGVKVEIIPLTSKQRIRVASGKVDLVISPWAQIRPEPSPYGSRRLMHPFLGRFCGHGNANAGTLEDLELSKVAPKSAIITRFGDNAATISAFVAGQVDVLVTGNTVAAKVSADNPKLNIETKFIIKESPCFIGVKSGEMNLLQWVNVFILHKKLGGQLNTMSKKWFGQKLPPLPSL